MRTGRLTEYSAQPSRSTLAPKSLMGPQRDALPSPLLLPTGISHSQYTGVWLAEAFVQMKETRPWLLQEAKL